jgi:hypothetical protein
VVNIGGGTDVVTGQITTTGPSQVLVAGTVELERVAGIGARAQCTLRFDGNLISLGYETTFENAGAPEASLTVLGSASNVAAGAHTATLHCSTLNGTVIKDDAAINMTGIPTP